MNSEQLSSSQPQKAVDLKETTHLVEKDSVEIETKVKFVLDPEKLRCLNSKEGLTTTITVIT